MIENRFNNNNSMQTSKNMQQSNSCVIIWKKQNKRTWYTLYCIGAQHESRNSSGTNVHIQKENRKLRKKYFWWKRSKFQDGHPSQEPSPSLSLHCFNDWEQRNQGGRNWLVHTHVLDYFDELTRIHIRTHFFKKKFFFKHVLGRLRVVFFFFFFSSLFKGVVTHWPNRHGDDRWKNDRRGKNEDEREGGSLSWYLLQPIQLTPFFLLLVLTMAISNTLVGGQFSDGFPIMPCRRKTSSRCEYFSV